MQLCKYSFKLNKKQRIILSCVFWILTFSCMGAIFMFSAQNGNESQATSDSFAAMFLAFLNNAVDINVIRKLAHFSEYAGLGFLVSWAMTFTREKYSYLWPFAISVIYSISDEIHQLFVPERAGRVFDVLVDSSGAATGILVFTLLFMLINFIRFKTKKTTE